jgi:transporter family-2 protein
VSGGAFAAVLTMVAGLAGSVQIAVMSRLGERVGVLEALGFSTLVTAVVATGVLVAARQSLTGYERALHQPWWMLTGGLRIGVAATVGIMIAGQLAMGAAIDRFGLFGSERIQLHWPRLLGILLLAVGAALSLRK